MTTPPPPDDGGPAFPHERQIRCCGEVVDHENMPGMSLRDWFAGQALAGWLASFGHDAPHPTINKTGAACAREAYRMADEMLAARKETTP